MGSQEFYFAKSHLIFGTSVPLKPASVHKCLFPSLNFIEVDTLFREFFQHFFRFNYLLQ